MDLTLIRSAYTVAMFLIFLGVCLWAYGRRRSARFDEAARLPFADEDEHERSLREKEDSDR